MEYKKYKLDNLNVYTIKTNKFKNCHIEVIYRKEVEKNELTADVMLCDILMRSSKKYPSKTDLSIRFEDLYNTSIYGIISKVGASLFTNYCLDFLHPKYTEKTIPEESIELLFEMIHNPHIKNKAFDKENFNIVKNNLRADIMAAKENVVGYAIRRMLISLDESSPSSFSVNGYLEDLDLITPEDLYNYYQKSMKNSICDIFVIGDMEMNKIVKIIKKYFKNPPNPKKPIKLFANNKATSKPKIVMEQDDFKQSNLVIGFNIDRLSKREKNIVFPLYNVILGAGSLENKLAKNLRTDNSLCYQTNSAYQKYDRLLIVYAGIDDSNYDIAVKLVKKALKEMEKGIISAKELESAKLLISSSLEMAFDNASTLVNNYVFEVIDKLPLIEKRIKDVKSVTKDEIMKVAKKVKLNTIYLLSPGGEK